MFEGKFITYSKISCINFLRFGKITREIPKFFVSELIRRAIANFLL